VSQPIEGDKPQRTKGFEYNRGTTGTVGTSGWDKTLVIGIIIACCFVVGEGLKS